MNLDTSYGDSSVTTATPGIPGSPGGGGMNLGGFGDVLNQLAQRRAYERQQQMEMEREKARLAAERQRQEMDLERQRFALQKQQMNDQRIAAMQDRNKRQIESQRGPQQAQRWMKYLPGIGPVEVAEGTFGAYAAGNVDTTQDAREHAIGLTPGVIGQNLGYFTAGQEHGADQTHAMDPEEQALEGRRKADQAMQYDA